MRDRILKYTIIIALLITALSNAQQRVDERLKPYVQEYFELLDSNNIEYEVSILIIQVRRSLKGLNYLGAAYGMNDDSKVHVVITPEFFNLDEGTKKWVIFHELSHDLFNLKHGVIELMNKRVYDYTDMKTLDRSKEELILHLKSL